MTARRPAKTRPDFPPIGPDTRLRGYVRRSYEGEDEATFSMDAQRGYLTEWAKRQGAPEIAYFYNDPGGKSRADTLARPVLMQAMDDARKGLYDKLVVWKYDRFSRDQNLGTQALFQFEAGYGVEVISTLEPVPTGPMATMMRQLWLFVAESEWNSITARFYGGRLQRVKNGSLPGASFALYGYQYADRGEGRGRGEKKAIYLPDDISLDANPLHAPAAVVRRLYTMIAQGATIRSAAMTLTAEGVPTPSQVLAARGSWNTHREVATKWYSSTVGRILSNTAYAGVYEAYKHVLEHEMLRNPHTGEMEEVTRRTRRAPGDKNIIPLTGVIGEPLVSMELWTAVQDALKQHKEQSPRNVREPEAALLRNGYAICGYCGSRAVARRDGRSRAYKYCCPKAREDSTRKQRCSPRWRYDCTLVDALVWDWLVAQLEQPERIQAKFAEWREMRDQGRVLEVDRRESLRTLIEAATTKRANCMELAAKTADAEMRAEYSRMAEAANAQVQAYHQDLASLEERLNHAAHMEQQVEDILAVGSRISSNLRSADFSTKRAILHAFNIQVQFWHRTHEQADGHAAPLEVSWVLDVDERVWHRLAGESQKEALVSQPMNMFASLAVRALKPGRKSPMIPLIPAPPAARMCGASSSR